MVNGRSMRRYEKLDANSLIQDNELNSALSSFPVSSTGVRVLTAEMVLTLESTYMTAGADLENFMTIAHRAWLVSRRGQTKEFCEFLLWG